MVRRLLFALGVACLCLPACSRADQSAEVDWYGPDSEYANIRTGHGLETPAGYEPGTSHVFLTDEEAERYAEELRDIDEDERLIRWLSGAEDDGVDGLVPVEGFVSVDRELIGPMKFQTTVYFTEGSAFDQQALPDDFVAASVPWTRGDLDNATASLITLRDRDDPSTPLAGVGETYGGLEIYWEPTATEAQKEEILRGFEHLVTNQLVRSNRDLRGA